jgi:pimeloyl-ACP methyl ester carboxylesterase
LPSEVAQRYRDASPAELLPLGVKQILITGTKDLLVPPKYGKEYEAAAQKSGDEIEMIEIENAGHFEVIAPNSTAWPTVERAVLSLVEVR